MKCTDKMYPPFETVSDRTSSIRIVWSISAVRAHLKWSLQCQMKCTLEIRYTPTPFQIRCTTETETRNEFIYSDEVFKFRYTPLFSDEVNNWEQNQKWVHIFRWSVQIHFQLLSLWNWPYSWVCPVDNIPSLGVKSTSSVLWSSANFCSISQNMHSKAPVSSQHWKTNKVAWTWKDDWPPWRTSTYERPFTKEGNYLVLNW